MTLIVPRSLGGTIVQAGNTNVGTGGAACWANGTGTASFDHFRATQYPDPALSLAPVLPRLGTSLGAWDALSPTGTLLGMDLSADGVNWTDVSAGAAMAFDGVVGFLSLPTTSLPTGAASWSIEAWCEISAIPASGYHAIVGFGKYANQQMAALSLSSNGTTAQFICSTYSGDITDPTNVAPGVPYHVVGTYDGASTRLYVNGVLVAGPSAFTLNIALVFANIGAGNSPAQDFFKGTIDEVAIYSSALNATQIANHYNAGIGTTSNTYTPTVLADSPLRFYQLDDIGSTALDIGSQAQNGTLSSGGITEGMAGLLTSRSGQPMPLFYAQPDPSIDGFSVNTSANYTSTNRTGGATGTWTFDTANSRLVATGGTNALYLFNAISRANIDFFADLDRSDAGGLVWRFVDASDFYYLLIADTQASPGTPNTMTLYRVASNTQTQLAQATLSTTYGAGTGVSTTLFWRGTYHRFRVSMLGSVITASFDGTPLITYTDPSPLTGAGQVGLFNNGGVVGSRYYQLWIQPVGDLVMGTPTGDIVTGDFVYTRQRLATTNAAITPQVLDLSLMAAGPNIRNGVQLASITYNAAYVGKTYDDLAKTSNYSWYVGIDAAGNKTIYFQPTEVVPSPWVLQSTPFGLPSDMEHDSNHAVETASNTLYRNRQILTGVIGTDPFSDPFVGDGKKTSFTLRYPIAAGFTPTITRNGAPQTIGLKGTTGAQWYYAVGDAVISQDTSGVVLQAIDSLTVAYTGTFTTSVTVDNVPAQQALALIENSSGIVEEVEDVSKLKLNVAAATTYAQQLIARYCIFGRTVTFKTFRPGLQVLQILTAFVPEYNLLDAQLLITEVDITVQTQPNNTVLYGYVVTASELPYIKSWSALLAASLLENTGQ